MRHRLVTSKLLVITRCKDHEMVIVFSAQKAGTGLLLDNMGGLAHNGGMNILCVTGNARMHEI